MLKLEYKETVLRRSGPTQIFLGAVYLADTINPFEVIAKWNNQGISMFARGGAMLWHYELIKVSPAVGMGSEAGQVKIIRGIDEA